MKRYWRVLAIILVVVVIAGAGTWCIGVYRSHSPLAELKRNPENNLYVIDAELNAKDKTLTAVQQVRYVNNEDVTLNEVYFHVYPNAFKKKETAPFLFDEFDRAYRKGFAPGSIDITYLGVQQDRSEEPLSYSVEGTDDTILKVKLKEPLFPHGVVNLEMKYIIHIPPASERFGYGENNFNLGNWYPVAAVYDKQGWNLDPYYPIGDPFYSDASDYEVTVTAPAEYTLAASGKLVEQQKRGDNIAWNFETNSMRDFAFVANKQFQVSEKMVEGVKVKSYYYVGDELRGQDALKLAEKSIKTFNKMYGKYPYPNYSVVETQFPSGMEYPGLVYINDDYYKLNSSYEYFVFTVVHETAHQWWYGVVGNDQVDEAWLDEGLTTYSEAVYMEQQYGKDASKKYVGYFEDSTRKAISGKAFDGTILKPLGSFKNWDDYGPAVYDMAAMTFSQLREQVGDKVFFDILRTYYKEYKFKVATTEDFIGVCERVSKKDLDDFFEKLLGGK